jgi:hypothetical protein
MDEGTFRKLSLLPREAEAEREENTQRKPSENGKVLPFKQRSKGDPTEPAA